MEIVFRTLSHLWHVSKKLRSSTLDKSSDSGPPADRHLATPIHKVFRVLQHHVEENELTYVRNVSEDNTRDREDVLSYI